MSEAPILILQMQRMGDLIMTFPLMGYLQAQELNRPIWIVAEPDFFQELLHIAPKATFFPPAAHEQLRTVAYHRIINVSHRPDAAALSGALSGLQRTGPYSRNGSNYIEGFWQLYRASIVHNNRHNLFHWSDLNILDCLETPTDLARICYPLPSSPQQGRVGIFTGASEALKRPSPELLGTIAKGLLRKGLKPLFLGGPNDVCAGAEAEKIAGLPGSNLCGRFPLKELATLLRSLDLFICADTGPMHLAAWTGTPILNLSMGPVNAWETGPTSPGHYVLRAKRSCTGCWQCTCPEALCHKAFQPSRVVLTAHTIITAPQNLARLEYPSLDLCATSRDHRGLYSLCPVNRTPLTPRQALSRFWQEWFIMQSGSQLHNEVETTCKDLLEQYPLLFKHMQRQLIVLSKELNTYLRHEPKTLSENFWQTSPPLLRPLSGYLHMLVQNQEYTHSAWKNVLSTVSACADSMHTAVV